MDNEGHGGGCCGITHIYGFDAAAFQTPKSRRERILAEVHDVVTDYDNVETADEAAKWHCAVEAVLNQHQLSDWKQPLLDCGFKEVFTFLNDNSGNACHVFYLETGSK